MSKILILVVDTWAQFHQRSTYSFYARRSQKRKKIQLSHKYLFTLLGSTGAKAARRTLMKLTPGLFFRASTTEDANESAAHGSTSGQNRGVSCLADQNTQREVVVECFAPYDDHR